jgi:predicted 2-oxoglutarate/Fe(II)-dependent dioxygenase YbiX
MTIIQLTKSGIVFSEGENDLKKLREDYDKNHWIKLPNFLTNEILQFVRGRIEQSEFQEKCYADLGFDSREQRLNDEMTVSMLEFLLNDTKLFKLIEKITGCPQIGCFAGRVYRLNPDTDIDVWHDDDVYNRMVSVSINLSPQIYSGGILQIQDCNTKQIIQEVSNTGFGDCVIFKIAPYLIHRVTKVTGKYPRTAFAGWFHSAPVYNPIFNFDSGDKISDSISELKLSRDSRISLEKDLLFHSLDDKTLVYNPKNTVCYGVDELGVKVLNMLCKEPMTIKDIERIILNEYDVDSKKCTSDLVDLIQKLETSGIVSTSEIKSLVLK